jgi:hypothetical protein
MLEAALLAITLVRFMQYFVFIIWNHISRIHKHEVVYIVVVIDVLINECALRYVMFAQSFFRCIFLISSA